MVERGRSRTTTTAVKTEGQDQEEAQIEEPKTPEPKSAAKVKSKKEGAAGGKSPAKRVTKKAKMEMASGKSEIEVDSGVEDGVAAGQGEVGGKEVTAGGEAE